MVWLTRSINWYKMQPTAETVSAHNYARCLAVLVKIPATRQGKQKFIFIANFLMRKALSARQSMGPFGAINECGGSRCDLQMVRSIPLEEFQTGWTRSDWNGLNWGVYLLSCLVGRFVWTAGIWMLFSSWNAACSQTEPKTRVRVSESRYNVRREAFWLPHSQFIYLWEGNHFFHAGNLLTVAEVWVVWAPLWAFTLVEASKLTERDESDERQSLFSFRCVKLHRTCTMIEFSSPRCRSQTCNYRKTLSESVTYKNVRSAVQEWLLPGREAVKNIVTFYPLDGQGFLTHSNIVFRLIGHF